MFRVESEQVVEYDPHRFSAEAAELGLDPDVACWPDEIETDIGNGLTFTKTSQSPESATYTQQLGCVTLVIFND